ncbi:MAG: septation protein IspZ [Polymorphobacter sp.]
MATKPKPKPSALAKFVLDFAPLLVFFAANKLAEIFVATFATMAVTLLVMLISYFRYGRIQPMQWVVGVMVFVFGTATLLLHDANFIKIKLTIIYLLFASVLLFGKLTGRPLLKMAFGEAFPALDADGWRKLTRNWIIFCLALAATNEVLRRMLTDDQWVDFKVWGVTAITFVFALAQAPILSRHAAPEKPEA